MKSFLTISISIFIAFLFMANKVEAQTARSSAMLSLATSKTDQSFKRTVILRDFLKSYDSPLATYAADFVAEANHNNIDWKLVAAISGVESYFGEQIPYASHNGWGYGVYGNNVRNFESWPDGIAVVSRALRQDYLNTWGATNIYEIGAIYAADPAWANKVTHFINLIEEFESKSSNPAISISI